MNWQSIAVSILMPLVVFGLGYIVSLSKRITDLRVLVSDEFVRKPELVKIEQTMESIGRTCTELLRAVSEIKGEMKGSGR